MLCKTEFKALLSIFYFTTKTEKATFDAKYSETQIAAKLSNSGHIFDLTKKPLLGEFGVCRT